MRTVSQLMHLLSKLCLKCWKCISNNGTNKYLNIGTKKVCNASNDVLQEQKSMQCLYICIEKQSYVLKLRQPQKVKTRLKPQIHAIV